MGLKGSCFSPKCPTDCRTISRYESNQRQTYSHESMYGKTLAHWAIFDEPLQPWKNR